MIWIKKFKNNRILNYIPAQRKPHGSVYALFSYLWTRDLHQHPEAGPSCCILAQQGCFSTPVLKHWLHSNPGWAATAAKVSFKAVTILSDREPQQETQQLLECGTFPTGLNSHLLHPWGCHPAATHPRLGAIWFTLPFHQPRWWVQWMLLEQGLGLALTGFLLV